MNGISIDMLRRFLGIHNKSCMYDMTYGELLTKQLIDNRQFKTLSSNCLLAHIRRIYVYHGRIYVYVVSK